MNKKAQVNNVVLLFFLMAIILFLGVALAFGSMIIGWVADEAVPELTNLGVVGDANLTQYAGYTITPVNTFVQSFSWLSGIVYIFALVSLLGLSFVFRFYNEKWVVTLFLVFFFLFIIISIFISNIYEDYYNDSGEVGDRLKEMTMLSWLILYSPLVMCIIGGISALIMFTGEGGEYT